MEAPPAGGGGAHPIAVPGFTYKEALRNANFWIICGSLFLFGMVVAVTQVLSIVFRTAAYENPIDSVTWTPNQIAFYSSLFMVWLVFLVIWKPLLGVLNDKIGLVGMMVISMTLMGLAIALGMYASPVLLAIFVIGAAVAAKRGKAQYTARHDQQDEARAASA